MSMKTSGNDLKPLFSLSLLGFEYLPASSHGGFEEKRLKSIILFISIQSITIASALDGTMVKSHQSLSLQQPMLNPRDNSLGYLGLDSCPGEAIHSSVFDCECSKRRWDGSSNSIQEVNVPRHTPRQVNVSRVLSLPLSFANLVISALSLACGYPTFLPPYSLPVVWSRSHVDQASGGH